MVAVLFGITLVASAGVGVVNMITVEPIAQSNRQAATTAALTEVLPPFDETRVRSSPSTRCPSRSTPPRRAAWWPAMPCSRCLKLGFGGAVRMMVGFDPDGRVVNINVLEQTETPGLGTKMCDEGNPLLGSVGSASRIRSSSTASWRSARTAATWTP